MRTVKVKLSNFDRRRITERREKAIINAVCKIWVGACIIGWFAVNLAYLYLVYS